MSHLRRRKILGSVVALVKPALIFGGFRVPALAAPNQNRTRSDEPVRIYDAPEAYNVYSAALKLDEQSRKEDHLLIANETYSFDSCWKREAQWPRLLIPAVRNYEELSKSKWRLRPEFSLDKPYDLLARTTLNHLLDNDFRDSSGYTLLSPVGFNSQKTFAIVLIGCFRRENGGGSMWVLEKRMGEWVQSNAAGFGCGWAVN
jgi:hypothetical protein